MGREIHLAAVDSALEGGCNGCLDKSGPGQSYRVWQLSLRSQTIRLCDTCMAELPTVLKPGLDAVSESGASGLCSTQPLAMCVAQPLAVRPDDEVLVLHSTSPLFVTVGNKADMTKAEMVARIKLLDDEMTANEEDNHAMQDEIDGLYKRIDALPPDAE